MVLSLECPATGDLFIFSSPLSCNKEGKMLKEKIQKLKEGFNFKENNKKTIENLVLLVVLIIIVVVAINYIMNTSTNEKVKTESKNKKLAEDEVEETIIETYAESSGDEIEEKLENILSKIKGVGNVKVMITYSQTSQIIPMYDEDTSTSTTEENDSGGGTRVINESSNKKEIIYDENDGVKTPVTQSIITPKVEGAIITAQGASNAEIKTNIIQAVEAVTGIATYKIQVFEMD